MPNAYTDEMDLSVERQFWGESSCASAYVRKMMRNQFGALQHAMEWSVHQPVQRRR